MSTNKDVVDLFGHSTCITESSPALQVGVLIPGARIPQSLGPSKFPKQEAILATVISSPAMRTDKHLISNSITAKYHIEIVQYNANVTLVYHRNMFGLKHLFPIDFTDIGT